MTDTSFQLRTTQPLNTAKDYVHLHLDGLQISKTSALLTLSSPGYPRSRGEEIAMYLNRAQLLELSQAAADIAATLEESPKTRTEHLLNAEVRADQARVRAERDAALVAQIFERIEAHDNGEAFIDQWDLLPVALRLIEEGKLRKVSSHVNGSFVVVAAV